MKFEDYTWDKEFEIKGYFSELPGDVINNSLSGILHYSPSEIILELVYYYQKSKSWNINGIIT